jgi:cytochrome P450
MVSSAVMDRRRFQSPTKFDPERDASDGLLFGYGLHRCIGAPIAEAQIVQTLKPLLRQRGLRAAPGRRGKLQTIGPFPEHLFVQFDAAE